MLTVPTKPSCLSSVGGAMVCVGANVELARVGWRRARESRRLISMMRTGRKVGVRPPPRLLPGVLLQCTATPTQLPDPSSRSSRLSSPPPASPPRPHLHLLMASPATPQTAQWNALRNEYLQLKSALEAKLDEDVPSLRGGQSPSCTSPSFSTPADGFATTLRGAQGCDQEGRE